MKSMDTPRANPEGIPRELQEIDRWVLWTYQERDGRITKVPQHLAVRGAPVDASDSANHLTFDAANAMQHRLGTGLGIAMSPHDGLVILDLDDCLVGGALVSQAQRIVDRFRGCYAEVSVSGTGLHLVMWGPTEPKRKFVVDGITVERFASTGYVCITGKVWSNGFTGVIPVKTSDLAWLERTSEVDRLKRSAPQAAGRSTHDVSTLSAPIRVITTMPTPDPTAVTPEDLVIANSRQWRSDGEVIRSAWKYSPEKIAQYQRGDPRGYASPSELDQAAAAIIAYWCFGNQRQTERILRELAPPQRQKLLQRPNYVERTAAKGAALAIKELKKQGRWDPVRFLRRNRKPVPCVGHRFP